MSAPQTVVDFRTLIERSGLLPPEALDLFFSQCGIPDDSADAPGHFAEQLVRERLLTRYQADRLNRGQTDGFFLTDKYKILEYIGAGGMGKIYLCEQLVLRRLVAVKVLHSAVQQNPESISVVERFYREARAVAALDHPNIVRVFDVDRTDTGPFMVLEYVDGTNLHDIVAKMGALTLRRALHYVNQAALGLEHAHRAGLIHRDVKPSNLLLDRNGVVKLLDLGLARFSRDQSKNEGITARFDNNVVMGTVDFMAPEQAVDSSKADIRSDLYSLGCSMYFLLTGRIPFPAESLVQKMYAHQNQAPESISMVRPGLPAAPIAVMERLMEKDPAHRFQTPGDLVAALSEWTSEPMSPPPEEEMPRIPASYFRLGLSRAPAISSAMVSTPSPAGTRITVRHPRDSAWNAPASATISSKDTIPPLILNPQPTSSSPRRSTIIRAISVGLIVVFVGGLSVWLVTRNGPRQIVVEQPKPQDPAPVKPKDTPIAVTEEKKGKEPGPFVGAIISSGGSTFINPLMTHWSAIYEKRNGVRIHYQAIGSSKGVQGVIDRVLVFGCTEAFASDELLEKVRRSGGNILHIPLTMGAVVPTYNLPDVSEQLRFTGPILADIYLGKIVRWNDEALQAANPGVKLPDMPITTVHRADGSGTTFIWTDYLSKSSAEWKKKLGAHTEVDWPNGLADRGNNGVAGLVSRNTGSIGYVELTYAMENNLKYGKVKNREGHYVLPNLESVTAAAAAMLRDIPDDLRYSLTDAPGETSYPIAGTAWAILYLDQSSRATSKELVEFLRWATHEGQAYAKDLRYAPLPVDLVKRIDDKLGRIVVAPK